MFKVSIIIPVFNRENFVKACVTSVLRLPQTGEIILIDDGSTDNSYLICQELKKHDSKIKLLTHPNRRNMGVSVSRNLGIMNAEFEYISFLDSDDLLLDHRFQKDELVFEGNPEVNVTYSLSQIQFENGVRKQFGTNQNSNNFKSIEDFYAFVLTKNIILGHISSVTFRSKIFKNLNLWFDERLKFHEDTEFCYRIARSYFFYSSELENPVSVYVQHKSNTIKNRSKSYEFKFLIVFMDNIGLEELLDIEKNYVLYQIARTISNPVKNHFLRKSILHSFQLVLKPVKNSFILWFYKWGMNKYQLYR